MPRPVARLAGRLVLLLLAVAPAPAAVAACVDDAAEPVRRQLLAALNSERAERAVRPLRFASVLCAEAQHQAELAARFAGQAPLPSSETLLERIVAAGYDAQQLAVVLAQSNDDPRELAAALPREDPKGHEQMLAEELQDLGIGVVERPAGRVWVLLAARSWGDTFTARTAPLADLEAVRRDMLERVNAARRAARVAPLRRSTALDTVAQRYAETMLQRGFYGHQSPQGETVSDRVQNQGYAFSAVGENLARGQFSVVEVMREWMQSAPHRRNLLEREFSEAGFGVAWGRGPAGWQILWVQCFARPAER